jgi:Fic family protein/DNA-binding Xre family transcriptional regulator
MLLEKIRIEKNIKIKDLAAKLNIDSSLMSRILSNKRKPSIAQLKILSDFLEIDFNEIMKEYLADEVLGVLKDYPQIAKDVLIVAEERIQYLSGKNRFKTIALSKQLMSRLKILDELSKKWKNIKPLNEIQLRKMEEYFFTSYTYESNRIEGNTLTLQETHLVINEGITIGGKSMREHLELINHREAIDLILDLVRNKIPFNSFRLKQIHQLILKGVDDRNAGVYRSLPVRISGSSHVPPEPFLIEKMMEDYFIFYETQKDILHPVILAAEMHERLVTIHPFIDGNGRTSRLVMNLILLYLQVLLVQVHSVLKHMIAIMLFVIKIILNIKTKKYEIQSNYAIYSRSRSNLGIKIISRRSRIHL